MKSVVRILVIALLLLGMSLPAEAQTGEERFLQGMMKEEGEGNLKDAIAIYTNLVEDKSVDRAIRAKALLQVGICYEKLGVEKATSAFEKLIAEYADQSDLIAVAKRKLRSLKGSVKPVSKGLLSQRIQKNVMSPRILNSMSPDGRYYSFFESTPRHEYDNTIVVHDLHTDKMTSVSEFIPGNQSGKKNSGAWKSIWSPDSKKLAYDYANNEDNNETKREIHLVNADGSGKKVLYSNSSIRNLVVFDFSPDGKKILCGISDTNGQNSLMELAIATGDTRLMKTAEPLENIGGFKYSPNGPYVTFHHNGDVYTLNSESGEIEQVTFYDGMDSSPIWSQQGDKLIFISDRQGSNDLFYVEIINGKPTGAPVAMKRQLGEGARIMGMGNDGSIFVEAGNSRTDIYTVDFSDGMDLIPNSKKRITLPNADNSNGLARFSNNGKYISYQSRLVKMADGLRADINSKYHGFDEELGYKYSIYVYNSETEKTKLLDLPLYLNHYPRSQAWMVPTWSFHGNELLVHGRIRENFEGGFFIVDVEKETITPALTKPNRKMGMKWDEVEVGNSMYFSRNKDVIYYQTPGWKQVIKFNMKTGEAEKVAEMEDGSRFSFEGFMDKEETILIGSSGQFGYFNLNINTGEIEKFGERGLLKAALRFRNKTKGFEIHDMEGRVVFQDVTSRNELQKFIKIVFDSGEAKEFNLYKLFPDCLIRLEDYEPVKKQLLLSVIKDPGKEIYKIANLFE
jgi:Tol biopolymer transport system component